MPSSEKNHNFKEIPKQLATESQLWDESLKKEIYLMPEQIFPLIKEIYGISYPPNTSIQPIATEYSIERSDTKEITSLRADITLNINAHDIYHFECESKFPFSAVLFLQDNKNIPDTLFCKILASTYDGQIDIYESTGIISDLTVKGLSDTDEKKIENGTCTVSIEFRDSNYEDMYLYLTFILVKEQDDWKIQFYGIEG